MKKKKITKAKDIHVTGDFIAGDQYNYYYTGDFASLAEYYISPESVFQRVRTDDFIGRDWLTAKVDAFLNDPKRKSGAFLLIGDAGVGKTAFMAHLVKERRYLHLFAEQAPGQAMVTRALQSLESQLITRYQIDPYHDRDTLNALADSPDFLERILRYAAEKLAVGEKIVIVCDALDEAGVGKNEFVFGLPKELPDGVYFILSQRTAVGVKLPNFEPVIEKIEAQGEGNLQDMQAYLSTVAKRPEVAGQIRSKEYSEEFFVQTLKEKSQGVWMYLHYIIKEIESGARAPLDLVNLPTGLVGYYAEYWDAWRTGKRGKGEEAWDELYAPLLTTLAAAQEAIPVDWLIQWADVTAKPREVTRLLTEHWRAFITEKDEDGKKTYAPYHLSFSDFITGRVDTSKLPPAQANLVKDLAAQTMDAHKHIANAFEKECNSEWEKLVEQDYPRLHLTAHLNGAGEYEKLRMLLTEGDEKIKWAEAREQKEETYTSYLNDLTYIWDYAEREKNYALAIRCVLIENRIHSLASNITAKILASSVKDGLTSHRYYLNVIRLKPHPVDKAEAIEMIAPELPKPLLKEALIIANEIRDETWRFYALLALIPYLPNELKEQASQDALSDIKDDIANSKLEDKLRHLYKSQFEYLYKDLILMFKNEDTQGRGQILIEIANLLSSARKETKSPEVAIIKTSAYNPKAIYEQTTSYNREYFLIIKSSLEYKKYILLINYFACFSSKQKNKFLSEIKELESKYVYVCVLTKIIPALTSRQKSKAIQKILFLSTEFQDDLIHLSVLSDTLDFVDGKLRVKIIQTALQILNKNNQIALDRDGSTKLVGILKTLASKAESTYVTDFFSFVCNINNKDLQTRSIYVLLPYLNEELKRRCFLIALEADAFYKLNILRSIVPFITDEQKMILVESLRGKNLYYETELLASLLPTKNRELIKCIIDNVSAEAISSFDIRSDMLVKILPLLDEEEIEFFSLPILLAIRGIKKASLKANLLLTLSSQLKSKQKELIIQESLSVALKTARLPDRVNLLIRIALMLDEKQRKVLLQEAAKAAFSISGGYSYKITSLTEVAKHLLDERPRIVQEVLSMAKTNSGDAEIQTEALVQLSALFENESETKDKILQDAFAVSLKTKTGSRAKKIYSSFDESQKNILIHASLVNTRTTSDMFTRALILKNISLLVDNFTKNALLRESFLSAKKVEFSWRLADLLIELVQEINIVELKSEVFLYALSVFENYIDNIYRLHYFEALVSQLQHLDSDTQERTFSLIDKLDDKRDRLEALRLFTELSNENIKKNLLLKVQKIGNIFVQGKALGFVFTEDKDGNNLLNFDEQNKNANLEGYIIPYLKMNSQEEIKDGFELILALTPALFHFRGPEIADELYRTITDVTRWWP